MSREVATVKKAKEQKKVRPHSVSAIKQFKFYGKIRKKGSKPFGMVGFCFGHPK